MDFENESCLFDAGYSIWFGLAGIAAIWCSVWLCSGVFFQRNWVCTDGTITYSDKFNYQESYTVANRKHFKNKCGVTVKFTYEISGQTYNGSQVLKDNDVSRWERGRWYREHHNMKMPIYYNPGNHSESVVYKDRFGFSSLFLLLVGIYGLFDAYRAGKWAIYKLRKNNS